MKLKLKSKSRTAVDHKVYQKIVDGWKVIKRPYKSWFGKWVVIMEK